MAGEVQILRAKLARAKAAKKWTDGAALGRAALKEEGRQESEAARRAEAAAKSARREARNRP
ncbi:hypothetical protein SLNWT_6709 [Streptomyces albus]|uniref:CsbD family protein n=1 Tax=Streptomyces albus (strain ATCC 21838 / DSM 41398 / FERM P-419 / JCM 4703 / NBRC 107858) TaxID=1081613 RepID=A0A0B5F650_STRA4|nr:hypothetical protein SLNWT_6709 [Streptomyces albus]AOU81390.1 hypothetical protein SLNHY_6699 [Streptomyces albus]AYN37083.1 hypothetical protein DUI70_6590 [Streptomyces albus]